MSTSVTANLDGLSGWVATSPQVNVAFERMARRVADEAAARAPSDTGRLAGSIRVEQSRTPGGQFAPGWAVIADTPYALFVHEGTRPHPIVGRPLLAFFWPKVGRDVVFARVNHPGTQPDPFLTDALQAVF